MFLECLLCLLHAPFGPRSLTATEGVLCNAQLRALQDREILYVAVHYPLMVAMAQVSWTRRKLLPIQIRAFGRLDSLEMLPLPRKNRLWSSLPIALTITPYEQYG